MGELCLDGARLAGPPPRRETAGVPATVLIAGGGFGGLYAARELERRVKRDAAEITLLNDANFLLYAPLLPGVGGGTLDPRHVVVPLREELRRTEVRVGRVTGADPERSVVRFGSLDGEEELGYDHLVVALGSTSKHPKIPGLPEHSLPFKSVADALALRNRVLASFERAEELDDDAERASHLSYVFAGGGYTGVEALAELQDFAVDVIRLYPRCAKRGMRWVLVEGEPRIMREVPASLAAFTTCELERRGIEVRTGIHVDEVREDSVHLTTGETIPARTLVWTAGITPCDAVAELGLPVGDHRRIETDAEMRVAGHSNVWAIGDAAGVPDPAQPDDPCPQTAQHALRQGRAVARNVAAALSGDEPRPFDYRTKGVVVGLGRHKGVASLLGLRLRGFPGWLVTRTYHLAAMPGTRRRARLMSDWTLSILFKRDSAELG
jgi:NADH:ubiquinone reductase (H+-translocating)